MDEESKKRDKRRHRHTKRKTSKAIVDPAPVVSSAVAGTAAISADLPRLHAAAALGDVAALASMVSPSSSAAGAPVVARADPNEKEPRDGRAPLHFAANADVVRVLIGAGASSEAEDGAGRTPLHAAAAAGRHDVASAILAGGGAAAVNRRDGRSGDTALHIAAAAGSLQLCSALVSARADPNVKNAAGSTALHSALAAPSVPPQQLSALVGLLCDNGANVRARDGADRTPLHLAAGTAGPETDIVSYLLKHGAQIDAVDKEGRQALDYATKLGHEAKCHLLTSSGADVGLRYRPGAAAAAAASGAAPSASAAAGLEFDRWGFEEDKDVTAAANGKAALKEAAKRAKKERERSEKWARMMHPATVWDKTLKKERPHVRERCMKGIPESTRGTAWQLMTRAAVRRGTYPADHFAGLIAPDGEHGEQIDLDINRAFRAHVLFRERYGKGQIALYNVLKAYSNYDREVGYTQGMCEIAAMLLMYMPEEDAFWTLVQLLNEPEYAMRNMFMTGFPALHTAFYVHTQLVRRFLPKLSAHFEKENITTIFYATKWFMTIFIDVLPFEFCLRVWDVLFFDGMRLVHTIALRILERFQKQLLAMPFDQLMYHLTSLKWIQAKPDDFLVSVTKNPLPNDMIDRYRLDHTRDVFKGNAAPKSPARGAASSSAAPSPAAAASSGTGKGKAKP